MIGNKILLIEQIVFSSLTASIGNIIVKESAKKRLEIFQAMQSASYIFCGIISCVFCLLVNDVIYVWLGENFMFPAITVIAISLNTYLACVLQPLWIYRDATGIYMKTKYVMLAGAIINIVLSIVLGYFFGIAGILFASAIARLSTYFWYEPKLLFKEYFETSVLKYYIEILKNVILVAGTIIVCFILFRKFIVTGWGTLLLKAMIVGSICGVVFLVAYVRTEGFQIIWNKMKSFLKK
jgi:O-antigen/teichoic acid export membrane protein